MLNVLSASPRPCGRGAREVNNVIPGALSHSAAALTLVLGVLLILLARALRRRKRRAWRAIVVLLAVSTGLHTSKGLDVEEASIAFLLLVALVLYRRDFRAKGDPTTRWRAVWYGIGCCSRPSRSSSACPASAAPASAWSVPPPLSAQFEHVIRGLVGLRRAAHVSSRKGTTTWSPGARRRWAC